MSVLQKGLESRPARRRQCPPPPLRRVAFRAAPQGEVLGVARQWSRRSSLGAGEIATAEASLRWTAVRRRAASEWRRKGLCAESSGRAGQSFGKPGHGSEHVEAGSFSGRGESRERGRPSWCARRVWKRRDLDLHFIILKLFRPRLLRLNRETGQNLRVASSKVLTG